MIYIYTTSLDFVANLQQFMLIRDDLIKGFCYLRFTEQSPYVICELLNIETGCSLFGLHLNDILNTKQRLCKIQAGEFLCNYNQL